MRHLHVDPLGGAAGDMIIAALLDAFPELQATCEAAIRAAGLPSGYAIVQTEHHDGAFVGRRFEIRPETEPVPAMPDNRFTAIIEMLRAAPLTAGVRERACAILELIGRAEAQVHGLELEQVHFHELADWDSIADVVGAAALIDALQPMTVSLAPLPLGSGRIASRHGWLPVPAPATALLLGDLPVIDDGIGGERVTPTGAAILRHLAPAPCGPSGVRRLARTGHGFGTRRLIGVSNLVRVLVYEPAEGRPFDDERIGVITFEVDDMSPEALAIGLDRLRAVDGVLDVIQFAGTGKKGRVAIQVQILTRADALDQATLACFAQTTTIGLRRRIERRAALSRTERVAAGARVKVVDRPGGATVKVESEDLRDLPDHALRERRRRTVEDAVDEDAGGA